jgi:hypothetical protein
MGTAEPVPQKSVVGTNYCATMGRRHLFHGTQPPSQALSRVVGNYAPWQQAFLGRYCLIDVH